MAVRKTKQSSEAGLARELKESRAQQAATAAILKVIRRSPGDAQPVFDAIVRHAPRLLGGQSAGVYRIAEGMLHLEAFTSTGRAGDKALRSLFPMPVAKAVTLTKAVRTGRPSWTADTEKVSRSARRLRDVSRARGHRSIIVVPMLREGAPIGILSVNRREPGEFDGHEIRILEAFAEQAVIAIDNARRFKEAKEALERQTATAEILKVIASTRGEVQPVFDSIVRSAARLFDRKASLRLVEPGGLRRRAWSWAGDDGFHGAELMPLDRNSLVGRAALEGKALQIGDTRAPGAPPYVRRHARRLDFRSNVAAPLERDGKVVGVISLSSRTPGALSAQQLGLLATFADQAVIAIENVRLFNETRESLERQTATAEILRVISRSPDDVQPVFDTIVRSATWLVGGHSAVVWRLAGDMLQLAAFTSTTKAGDASLDAMRSRPLKEAKLHARAVRTREPAVVADTEKPPAAYAELRKMGRARGYRSVIVVPMLKDGVAIGTLSVTRKEARPFNAHHVSLLQTFADQAVIAIENVRLFNETREALERQTASSEVLRIVARSMADAQPVFQTILASTLGLFEGFDATVWAVRDDNLVSVVRGGATLDPKMVTSIPIKGEHPYSAVIRGRKVIRIDDVVNSREISEAVRVGLLERGRKAIVMVPLVRDEKAVGALSVSRTTPYVFSDAQVALLANFADQAVIAIENARLFNETKEALERQTATAEILRVISSSPTDVQPVFDAIVKSCTRLLACSHSTLRLIKEGQAKMVASNSTLQDTVDDSPMSLDDDSLPTSRAVSRREVVQIPDTFAEGVSERIKQRGEKRGFRSLMIAPMSRDGNVMGTIHVHRAAPGRFAEKEVALLETFASQAVIAIENVRLFNETKEALERQTATAAILRAISQSPTDTRPVFEAIVNSCLPLFGGMNVALFLRRGDLLDRVAFALAPGTDPASDLFPVRINPQGTNSRALLTGRPVQVADVMSESEATGLTRQIAQRMGFRSIMAAPLLREGEAIGTINVFRAEPSRFSEQDVELLKTVADQAVIAIENVRLFNETKEALERQTATAEILKVIASSPSDVQPVFDAIVRSAMQLTDGLTGALFRSDGSKVDVDAVVNPVRGAEVLDYFRQVFPVPLESRLPVTDAIRECRVLNLADLFSTNYPEAMKERSRAGGYSAALCVPMRRGEQAIGAIAVTKRDTGPFPERHVALLQTFADQAVIAIENVRLFNETREALEQQTATAQILQVISESPTSTQPVFDAIVRSGLRLFPNAAVAVVLPEGNRMRMAAVAAQLPAQAAAWRAGFQDPLSRDRMHGIAILDGRLVDVPDAENEKDGPLGPGVKNFLAGGNRAITIMPMICDDTAIGAISVIRQTPGPLSEKQLALLRTFAAQAVIAIENVRVFKELEARTGALTRSVEQLTALGEVGRAVSSTLDLETVLQTIVQRALQLTGLDGGTIYEHDEKTGEFHLRAAENLSEELVAMLRETPARRDEGVIGRAVETRQPIEIAEMLDDSYQSSRRDSLIKAGYRALLVVPLMREEQIIGVLAVNRKAPGSFPHEVVELLKTFATQSAVAIQNARLFREIAEKGRQLEEASQHKSHFLASMSHELRTPLNAILGFNELILGQVYGEVPQDMKEPLEDVAKSGKHLLRLINNVLDLAKIEAGRMELALADYSVEDTVGSVHSTLRPLAADKGLEFLARVPADLPLAHGDPGRIAQCLMNLAGNSLKFTPRGRVEIAVAQSNGLLRYSVSDTGIGIPKDKIASLFTEFKQTDATIAHEYGGTGLGLAITRKFIEMHGGRIWVESELGRGSSFIFEVPLRVQA